MMHPDSQPRPKKRGPLVLRWVITIGLLALVATQVDFQQLAGVLWDIRWGWVVAAAVAVFGDRVIATVRWWLLLRVKGIDIGFLPLLSLHLAANFVGGFLPTSFGADAARIVMLARRSGRTVQTVAASAADRLIMIVATIAAALAMSTFFVRAHFPSALQWAIVGAGAAGMIGFVTVVCVGHTQIAGNVLRSVLGERIAGTLGHLYRSVCEYRQNPAVLTQCAGMSVAMLGLRALVLVWLAAACGVHLPLATALVLWPILAVILMLPVSVGNFGLQEGAYVALLGMIGIPAALAVSASLLDHILARVVVLPGALCWLWSASTMDRSSGADVEAGVDQ